VPHRPIKDASCSTDNPRHACHVRRVLAAFVTSSTACRHRLSTRRAAAGPAPGQRRHPGRGGALSVDEISAPDGERDAPERAMGAPARDVTDVTENIFISRRRDRRVVRRDGLRHVVELATA